MGGTDNHGYSWRLWLAIFLATFGIIAALVGFLLIGWREGLNVVILVIIVSIVVSLMLTLAYRGYQEVSRYLLTTQWEEKSRKLFREGLARQDYLDWQQSVLEFLYPNLEIVSVHGKKYSAVILRAESIVAYPFNGLCQLRALDLPQLKPDKKQKEYIKILGNKLRAPKMKGFALSRIHYNPNGKTRVFDAITTNQEQNLITCHILEWELFEFFERQSGKFPKSQDGILRHLPYRARFHDKRDGMIAISEPHNAYPLISVQAIVIFLDTTGKDEPRWRVVLAKRSDIVVVKPGLFQFQPAGGFEVFGSQADDEHSLVEQGFDIGDALLREFAEELFAADDLRENTKGEDPHSVIRSHPLVRQLIEAVKKKTAWIEFIGTIVDLTILRPELSFLILIEDDFFCKSRIGGSWEAKRIQSYPVEKLGTVLAEGKLHGSSAGLLQLAIENKRLQKLGIAKALNSH